MYILCVIRTFIIGVLVERLVVIGEVLLDLEGGTLSIRPICVAKETI